jgi:hypothetical protein
VDTQAIVSAGRHDADSENESLRERALAGQEETSPDGSTRARADLIRAEIAPHSPLRGVPQRSQRLSVK